VNTRRVVVVVAVVAAIAVSGCAGRTSEPTTTTEPLPTDLPALEFGSGALPITVPANFPMPEPSAITTSMIDGTRELTEVAFNVGGNIEDVTAFYATKLPLLGYELSETSNGTGVVTIAFVGHGIDGSVTLKVAGENLTTATLVFVYA
jgi:hypothetical protein